MKTKQQLAEYNKVYYEANREKAAVRRKVRYANNRDEELVQMRAYREANYEKTLALSKAWRNANPSENLALKHRSRAKKLGVKIGDTATIIIWIDSWRTEAPVSCHYCKAVSPGVKMTVDHVIPISKGGDHDLNNLVVCCKSCNSSKKDQLLEVWLAQIGL